MGFFDVVARSFTVVVLQNMARLLILVYMRIMARYHYQGDSIHSARIIDTVDLFNLARY